MNLLQQEETFMNVERKRENHGISSLNRRTNMAKRQSEHEDSSTRKTVAVALSRRYFRLLQQMPLQSTFSGHVVQAKALMRVWQRKRLEKRN